VILFLFSFLVAIQSQTYFRVQYTADIADSTCNSVVQFQATVVAPANCVSNSPCTCSGSGNSYCTKTVCNVTDLPSLSLTTSSYSAQDCPANSLTSVSGLSSGSCIAQGSSSSLRVTSCSSGSGCADSFATVDCTGTSNGGCTDVPNGCTNSGSSSTSISGCSSKCFHKDTVVSLKGGRKMTLASLKKADSPCFVPHSLHASGVKLTTSCSDSMPLRLSGEHLVWTPSGYVTAGSLKVGDYLYNQDNNKCEITRAELELNQEYFALNCEDSEVLADGWKVSTFGITHNLPSMWMKVGSQLFGVKFTSIVGDKIASFASYMGLIL